MVERENLHLNFSFLGEIDENQTVDISRKIDLIGTKLKRFEVEVGGLLSIPSENYIRVLALDVIDNTGRMKSLFEEIKRSVGGDSKPPHITLCRVKSIQSKNDVREKIRDENTGHGRFILESVQLIKSELNRSGPTYSVIHDAKFV